MRNYTFGVRKARLSGSMKLWLVVMALAVGLLVYDYVQYGNLMTYVFTGIK